jgi:F0F1-type ATP synthase beta subunit
MVDTASKTGFISQIIGPVIDIEFPNGEQQSQVAGKQVVLIHHSFIKREVMLK